MTSFDRRRAVEALLSDWFRREGFSVRDGLASQWIASDEGGFDGSEVDLSRLADFLSDELERALA